MRANVLKTKGLILTILVATFVLCSTALAQSGDSPTPGPLILTDEQDRYPMGLQLEILEDPSGELTIEDVSSPEFDPQFQPSQEAVPNFGFSKSAYWVRFHLQNETRLTDQWLLEVAFPNIHFIDLYTPIPDGDGFAVKQTGVMRPPETRDILHPHFVFNLTLPTQIQQTAYLRIKNEASTALPIILWTPAAFFNGTQWLPVLHMLIYGALIGLLIYNLFILVSLREVSYFYLVILIASILVFDVAYAGYMEIYITPGLYHLRKYYVTLSFALFFVSMILFADSFLELKKQRPILHRLNVAILGVWGVLMLLVPFSSYQFIAILMVPWGLISLGTVLAAGILTWRQDFRPARFFMIAWFGLIATFILVLLVRLGVIPSTLFSENGYRLGLVWMAVCWSIALADRINLLKTETEAANLHLRNSEHRLSQILEGLPIGVFVYGKDQKLSYVNQRTIDILSNPDRDIQVDVSAGQTLAQAMSYFKFQVAGSHQEYPLEDLPVYRALQGEPASVDDIEADLVARRVPLEIWASPVRDEAGDVESAVVAFQDITEQKQKDEAIIESRERYLALSEAASEAIFISEKGVCLEQNSTAEKMFGYTLSEAVGRQGIEWIAPEDRQMVMKNMLSGYESPYQATALRKDGSTFSAEIQGRMMQYKGRAVRVTALSDISERKQALDALQESEEKFRTLVTDTEQIVFMITKDGTFLLSEGKGLSKLGLKPGEIVGKSVFELYADYPDMLDSMRKAFNGETTTIEVNVDDNHFRNWYTPHKDHQGEVIGLMGLSVNITEQKRVEQELRESEERFRATFEQAAVGIDHEALGGRFLRINQKLCDIVGYSREEMLGRTFQDITHPDDLDIDHENAQRMLDGQLESYPIEKRYLRKNGEIVWVNITVSLVREDTGGPSYFISVVEDITERKQIEAEVVEYRKHLEQLVEERTVELSTVNEQLQLRLEWLSSINLVNQVMARSSDFMEIYRKVIEIINDLFAAQDSFIAEMEADSNQLKILAHSCQSDFHPAVTGSVTSLPDTIFSDPMIKGGNHAIYPKDQLSTMSGPIGMHIQHAEIDTVVLIPLQLREKELGFLGLEMQDKERIITPEEISLLNIFSTDIAQLIEDSHLYEQSKAMITATERNRLARDLHDSVTQVLFSANLLAEVLPQIWRRDPEQGLQKLDKLRRLTRGALAEMRTMLLELRPSAVINTPLGELLAQLIEATTSRSGLPIQIFIEQIPPLPEDVQTSLYRIAQEALNNVVKHAQAKLVSVSLSATPLNPDSNGEARHEIMLMIEDDGVGFSSGMDQSDQLGIDIMRERAAAIQARLSLDSKLGYGTRVTAIWDNRSGDQL